MPRLAVCGFNGASGFNPDDFIVLCICGGWGGFNSFECFSPGFSCFFALIIKPDCVVFNYFRFAFWNTVVSYTYEDVCIISNQVIWVSAVFYTVFLDAKAVYVWSRVSHIHRRHCV